MGLTESYTPASLVLIAGSNAFPSLTFTVAGGNTQTVCVPFQLQAAAADVDGAVTNLSILLDGSPIANAPNSPLATQAEIDFPALYTFTARAQDNPGGTSWATQEVAVMSWPLHWLLPVGLRRNGAFKLCLWGEDGRSYEVQATADPAATNWTVLGVMESTNGIWRFLDAGAATNQWRFYRAVESRDLTAGLFAA